MKKILALVNLNSGSVPKDAEPLLAKALSDLGYDGEVVPFGDGDLKDTVRRALDRNPDYLIAWGGDGSVNCAMSIAGPDGPPVLALPGGTMNMLHHRLHHDRTEWQEILTCALTDPDIVPWAAGEIEGHRFYVAVMAGRITTLSESRELVRKGAILEAIGTAARNEVFDMETRLDFRSRVGALTVKTLATAGAVVLAGDRRPRFDVAAIDPGSQLDLVGIGIQSLISGWRDAEDVTVEIATTVTLEDVHGDPIPATIDGEPLELPAICEFRLVPNSARVIRAKPVS